VEKNSHRSRRHIQVHKIKISLWYNALSSHYRRHIHESKQKFSLWYMAYVHVYRYKRKVSLWKRYTLESSLFAEDQCSWISKVTCTHEFTSPRPCFYSLLYLYQLARSHYLLVTHEIKSPRTSRNLVTHEH
jgi:hypothetical protein